MGCGDVLRRVLWKAWFGLNFLFGGSVRVAYKLLLRLQITLVSIASNWKWVFILSCVAVSFDCLFLYIPIIDQENKCLGSDKTLRNVALALRSLTDIAFIFHIKILIEDGMYKGPKWDDSNKAAKASWLPRKLKLAREAIAKKMPWLSIYIIVNFLAILPIPQVAIVVGFSTLGGSKHFLKQTIINVFLIFQYFLRIFQIFLSIKKVGHSVGKMVKGLFNFLLYLIASHVLAAFWYFFSIQRVTSCWDHICQTLTGCKRIYDCGGRTSLNSTSIYKLCQIHSPNATLFDFGMYSGILKSGTTGSTKLSTKLFYYFWWSLKNLSNFGTNLETSSYMWENCFAILISIIGLLLFLILIGNVQTYIQSETEKSVKIGELRTTKVNKKYEDIHKWLLIHGLPDNYIKTHIWKNIEHDKVVELINKDVDIKFMHSCYIRDSLHRDALVFICVNELKKISIFRYMDDQDLERFCYHSCFYDYPDYTTLEKDSYITRAGQQLDTLYLIIDGTAEDAQTMRRHDCVGEEVLHWARLNYVKYRPHRDPFPISPADVKCLTKIGAFTFTANQLIKGFRMSRACTFIDKTDSGIKDWLLRNGFPEDLRANIMNCLDQNKLLDMDADDVDVDFLFGILPEYTKPSIKRHLGLRAVKKVPMLRKMHKYALEIICNHLEPVVYMMNSYVVRAGKPLGFMIFILEGKVLITSSSEITEPSDENVIERGCYYGEQLLSWASPINISSADNPVISTRDVKCQTKVEALILKAEDLKSAASKCGSQWNFNNCMNSQQVVDVGKDYAANTTPTSTIEEEAIQLHQGHDMILEQLVLIRETIFRRLDDHGTKLDDLGRRLDDQGRRLDDMAALAKVGYTGLTGTSSTPSAL